MLQYIRNEFPGINYQFNDIDNITLEEIDLNQSKRRDIIMIQTYPTFTSYEIEGLYNCVNNFGDIEPKTRRRFHENEIQYINYYYNGFLKFPVECENKNKLIDDFLSINFDSDLSEFDMNLIEEAKFNISISDFYSHFKIYDVNENEFAAKERFYANEALNLSSIGCWLLRNSSINRPFIINDDDVKVENEEHKNYLKTNGIKYYAFSYNILENNKVKVNNILIKHQLGHGWFVYSRKVSKSENPEGFEFSYHRPCFIDILFIIMKEANLSFNKKISNYIKVD